MWGRRRAGIHCVFGKTGSREFCIASVPSFGNRLHHRADPVAVDTTAAIWLIAVVALGFAARSGRRWAFLIGIVLYGADMIALTAMFPLWAFGVHAFFVFRWFQGQKALKDINDAGVSTF